MADNPPPVSTDTSPAMADALARLWKKFLPDIEGRVDLLEAAAGALAAGSLSDELREKAHAAAHKLAGTLGTFGLHRGTELARQCENFLAGPHPPVASFELGGRAAELQAIIKSRA